MTLRPGDFLGLPATLATDPSHQIALRYALLLLTLAWAALVLRAGRTWAVLGGILLLEVVLGFWTLGFGRPYGLFVDPEVTRRAAETAVTPLRGADGFLAGEPREESVGTRLAAWGLPPDAANVVPTLLPLAVVPALALAVLMLWRPREHAWMAAVLWLAFSTSQTESVRGAGFLPGLWSRPGPALALVVLVTTILAAGRLRSRRLALATGAVMVAAWGTVLSSQAPPALGERLMLATFDQSPWIFLGVVGLARGAGAPAWALVGGGGLLFLFGPLWRVDAWGAHAMYRLGLMLASVGPVEALLRWACENLAPPRALRMARCPERLGLATMLVAALPGSFLAQWNPGKLDPLAFASRDPLPTNLLPAMEWIREHVPPEHACLASPDYAPSVAILGQRRVLRAPSLVTPLDDQRRRRAERMLAAEREPDLLRRYGIGCVVFASGDEGWLGMAAREELERLSAISPLYRDRYVWVYGTAPDVAAP